MCVAPAQPDRLKRGPGDPPRSPDAACTAARGAARWSTRRAALRLPSTPPSYPRGDRDGGPQAPPPGLFKHSVRPSDLDRRHRAAARTPGDRSPTRRAPLMCRAACSQSSRSTPSCYVSPRAASIRTCAASRRAGRFSRAANVRADRPAGTAPTRSSRILDVLRVAQPCGPAAGAAARSGFLGPRTHDRSPAHP